MESQGDMCSECLHRNSIIKSDEHHETQIDKTHGIGKRTNDTPQFGPGVTLKLRAE
jgi:hypothetical protein